MLWGAFAQKKGNKIDRTRHLILESGHPSPLSANQGKWFGNKHFSQANDYLIAKNKKQIDWLL
jgi:uracil-DNA glycosylase